MEDLLLNFSQSTGIYAFMDSRWGWPVVESLHFIGLSLLIGTVGLFDLRMLGVARGIPMSALHRLVPYGVAGFALNAVTGVMFFTTFPDQYLYNPAFQMKMLFILVAGINMALFYRFSYAGVRAAGTDASARGYARAAAVISLCCWIAVISAGRLITFFRPPDFWCFWCG